jgi:hypothetical protein
MEKGLPEIKAKGLLSYYIAVIWNIEVFIAESIKLFPLCRTRLQPCLWQAGNKQV